MPSGEDGGRGAGAAGRGRRRAAEPAAPAAGALSGFPRPGSWRSRTRAPLSDFDRLTLHQAVTIVALELLRARVAGDTERRLAGDVLAAVVRGELSGPELGRRLEPFGLADRVAAIVVERPDNGRGSPAPAELALSAALRDDAAAGLVASTGSLTCALVPGMDEDELIPLAERVGGRG